MLEIVYILTGLKIILLNLIKKNKNYLLKKEAIIHFNDFLSNYNKLSKIKKVNFLLYIDNTTSDKIINSIKISNNSLFYNFIVISKTKMDITDINIPEILSLSELKSIIDLINPDILINLSNKVNYNLYYILNKYNKKIISFINKNENNYKLNQLFIKKYSTSYYQISEELNFKKIIYETLI